ncbi:PadR family transcriptional regulator [Aeromicrobium sp. 50.2.37]|uniref:PadR family transcriptional regulator n=1 Tax=Aeromicrobium sp. 50.2.37 TaxID=2969305 RepID=UPI00214F706A|nr:PadR family transcriptional regulator [Aeromicrobium sp. 50.2.37]MCR4514544.1 PadR family transcriptional regulator [Aeromicrobium sp. 50.2.37]
MNLSMTSYAILGLLAFDGESETNGLTGYELKQRADRTLRFYWTSPAMSQIYTELDKLLQSELVHAVEHTEGRRTTRRFKISDEGRTQVERWLSAPVDDPFPVLKHPVALRLLMGRLTSTEHVQEMLDDYLERLAVQRKELEAVREMLGDVDELRYAARVADWGMSYYDSEKDIVERIRRDVEERG